MSACSREDEDDIVDAEIVDLEKKKELRKYYVKGQAVPHSSESNGFVSAWQVYVIEVSVKHGPKHIVYRRYNQFHNLSQILEERYPIEAGYIDIKDRTLPTLPGEQKYNELVSQPGFFLFFCGRDTACESNNEFASMAVCN